MLDPVYSGKALYNLKAIVESLPDVFQKGQKVLFIHTGIYVYMCRHVCLIFV
jgi:1-aminocyclopropane-1-carboxylate deaminase/D-cysteine desulfhydrase-like pyridoxal-dependent ACC family enzyme